MIPFKIRFWEKVLIGGSGCWEWQASRFPTGYGSFSVGGKATPAHRVAWELTNGVIPTRLQACHTCDNRKCVRPDHLFLGTCLENMADRDAKGRGKIPDNAGSKNGQSKLTESMVREIRRRYGTGTRSQKEIGRNFGLSQQAVSYAINGWKSVP